MTVKHILVFETHFVSLRRLILSSRKSCLLRHVGFEYWTKVVTGDRLFLFDL